VENFVLSQQDPAARRVVDPMFYVRVFARRRWMILAVLVAVVGATAVYGLRQRKVFSASASVIIDYTAPRFLDNQQVQDLTDPGINWTSARDYFETQYKVITSRAVAERVVEKLGLQRDAAFLGLDKLKDENARAAAMAGADAASVLQHKITVKPIKDSRIVMVSAQDFDPERAALLANEVAEAYINESLAVKMALTDKATSWLEQQRGELGARSRDTELGLYEFRRSADMLSNSLEDRTNIVGQELTKVSAELTETKLRIASLRARVDAIKALQKSAAQGDELWADALPEVAESTIIATLKVRYAAVRTDCADLRERYLDKHPSRIACEEKMASAHQDLVRELQTVVRGAETELLQAVRKQQNLQALQDASKQVAQNVERRRVDHDRLKREVDDDQRRYQLVLTRLRDIELSGLLRTGNVRVLDKARPGYVPVSPNMPRLLSMALMVGLIAGFGLALLLETLDNTVSTQRDIEEHLGLPFLGLVPRIEEDKAPTSQARDLLVHAQPKSSVAECCRAIRTNLLFMSPEKPFRSMLVTSSGPQEGKSTMVMNLGIAMAQSGARVLLVDTDMRRPRLHRAFGVPSERGVSALLVGEGDLDEAIKSTEIPNLFVLPCGPVPPNPAELLHTRAFEELLATLTTRFDRVILDSPPLGAVADAAVLATRVDGTLMVLKAGATRRELARRAVRTLADVQARVFGAILNNINLNDPKYGEYYAEYRRYGYYYAEKKDEAVA
jgi:polysaccharide biosynthesis transport protein